MTFKKDFKLPAGYCEQMKTLLGEVEFKAYLDSFDLPKKNGLRINTLKISVEDFLAISPFALEPIPWTNDGFYYEEACSPTRHPYYLAGLYYIQEPSAMAPVEALGIEAGDCCLDLCAAPGGKTLQMAARAGESGFVVSNDISGSRLMAVVRNIEIFGLKNVVVTCESVDRLADRFESSFDVVLVDAPCSGEGMFRKDPSLIKHWHVESNADFAEKQWQIMRHVPTLLKPGGVLGYSTCTFSPLENEGVIEKLLSESEEMHFGTLSQSSLFSESQIIDSIGSLGTARIYPHRQEGEGHFMAKLLKNGEKEKGDRSISYTAAPEPFQQFQQQYLKEPLEGRFFVLQEKLYLEPNLMFDFRGLRVLRSGWYLGDVVRGKFEPSQAFAMGLKSMAFKQVIDFKADDRNLMKYLKCETLDLKGEEGYHLVCVDGYPLGFCRLNKGVFKNMYPVSWRLIKEF
jgi:NOL1/NOP2/sun family putative RNA methylase